MIAESTCLLAPHPVVSGSRWLVIVARHQPALSEYLRRGLAGDPTVHVLVDRRQGERRGRDEPRESERRRGDRRRIADFHHDLRLHWAVVCRAEAEVEVACREPLQGEGRDVRMSMTETGMSEVRQHVERWIEESQGLLGRVIPGLLDDNERLRGKAAAAEQDADRMREEIAALRKEIHHLQNELGDVRTEHQYVRGEQAAVAEALSRAVHHMTQMVQPINEMVAKLHQGQPVSVEGALS